MRIASITKPLLFILLTVGAFSIYNLFLVDRNLESLKFSLASVAKAESVGSVSYLAPLMQTQFIDELSSDRLDTEDLIRLQYSADVIDSPQAERQVADVTSVLQDMINKKGRERNVILRFFDRVNDLVMGAFKVRPAATDRFMIAELGASLFPQERFLTERK